MHIHMALGRDKGPTPALREGNQAELSLESGMDVPGSESEPEARSGEEREAGTCPSSGRSTSGVWGTPSRTGAWPGAGSM